MLGKGRNEQAKDERFVPGGHVHKGERIDGAVHRIADEALGVPVKAVRRLGTYKHLWGTSDVRDTDGKTYITDGFAVRTDANVPGRRPAQRASRVRDTT